MARPLSQRLALLSALVLGLAGGLYLFARMTASAEAEEEVRRFLSLLPPEFDARFERVSAEPFSGRIEIEGLALHVREAPGPEGNKAEGQAGTETETDTNTETETKTETETETETGAETPEAGADVGLFVERLILQGFNQESYERTFLAQSYPQPTQADGPEAAPQADTGGDPAAHPEATAEASNPFQLLLAEAEIQGLEQITPGGRSRLRIERLRLTDLDSRQFAFRPPEQPDPWVLFAPERLPQTLRAFRLGGLTLEAMTVSSQEPGAPSLHLGQLAMGPLDEAQLEHLRLEDFRIAAALSSPMAPPAPPVPPVPSATQALGSGTELGWKQIDLEGLDIASLFHKAEGGAVIPTLPNLARLHIAELYLQTQGGRRSRIDSLTLDGLEVEGLHPTRLAVYLDGARIFGGHLPIPRVQATLKALGYETIAADFAFSFSHDLEEGALHVEEISMVADGVGVLTLSLRLGNYKPIGVAPGLTVLDTGRATLERLSLLFEDETLVARLLSLSARQSRMSLEAYRAELLAQINREAIPFQRAGGDAASIAALKALLKKGGAVHLTIEPQKPVALQAIQASIKNFAPAEVLGLLGAKLRREDAEQG